MGWNILVLPIVVLLLIWGHGWWALMALVSAHALWLAPTLWPGCGWCGPVMTRLPQNDATNGSKQVWLTIDDGPDAEDTPRLLDLLDLRGAKATFFFIGEKAARHPELVSEVVRRGHTLGNHTMHHSVGRFWGYGPAAVRREIIECQGVLGGAGNTAPRWFRAPAGLKNPWVHEVLEGEHLRLVCWSARGLDGVDVDKSRVLNRLKARIKPGAIVLMHEGRIDAQGRRLAPQVMEELLTWLAVNNYRCVLPDDASRKTPETPVLESR
jgi:peptidoglycan-N-acetylglucosamine deacetylase